ncbi:MAG: hypothetical protein EP318_21325 [Rhodobacteraceae bacterium]|nr:MAG: hypothetical protein EP318_21325 [Paracoccaceae bacterium]
MTIRTWLTALAGVLAGWIALMALVMVLSDAAPGAVALWPAADFIAHLPEGAAVVGGGPLWLMVKSDAPGLGFALYRAGAGLVLPAGLPGCFPLPGG